MMALVTSYPPLGQVTFIDDTTVHFNVLLETDESRASDNWEVTLWHSQADEWKGCPLDPVGKDQNPPCTIQTSEQAAHHRLYFTASSGIESPMTFTIKFRSAPDQPWKWLKDQQGSLDGTVISRAQIPKNISDDLGDFLKDLNPILHVKKVLSQSPGTSVWSITAPVEAAQGEESALVDIKLGLPWAGKLLRYAYICNNCGSFLEHVWCNAFNQ
jgi:hypothetical protein